jgi:integrase
MVHRRSYGSGRLFDVVDKGGRVSWYGSWWPGGMRVKRKIAVKRTPGTADGLTRAQAEKELRKRIERDVIVATAARRTLGEAGNAYVDHLEHVMERKRSTIHDYRGHLRRHLVPFFGKRFKDALVQAGVRTITFHELRHTFGTQRAIAVDAAVPRSSSDCPRTCDLPSPVRAASR